MVPANFNQLYYFWVIAKSGSVSAASKRLLLTQSTVSAQLKQLELSLGARLFERGRGGVTLTPEGRLSFEYCERIFPHAEELLALLHGGAALTPTFRLGVTHSISRDKILALTRFINGALPGAAVRIYAGGPDELESRLDRRLVDLVLADVDLSVRIGRDFESRLVGRVEHYFVAAPSIAARARSFPAGLQRIPLLLRSPENPVRKEVDHFLHRNAITPILRAEVDDPDLIRIMALQGEGACAMDLATIGQELREGKLVKLHAKPIGLWKSYWTLCSRYQRPQPALQNGIEAVMSRFRLVSAGRRP